MTNLDEIRAKFPVGTKVKLIEMKDEQAPPKGCTGVVSHVDCIGTVHMSWANGSTLGLIPGADKYEIL